MKAVKNLLAATAVALAINAIQAEACVWVPQTYRVHSDFVLLLQDRDGHPMAGLEVVLAAANGARVTVKSDEKGIAHFNAVPYGPYTIEGPPYIRSVIIDVVSRSAKEQVDGVVRVVWPDAPVLQTVKLEGRLIPAPSARSQLRLSDPRTKKVLGFSPVAPDGSFAIKQPPPGLSMLSVVPAVRTDELIDRDIFVQVDPNTVARPLEIGIGMTSCGFVYSRMCRKAAPISVNSLCGTVVDSEGAVIGKVDLGLVQSGVNIARTRSDNTGTFQFDVPPGTYDFTIDGTSQGFVPAQSHVTIRGGACDKSLTIGLPILDFQLPICTWAIN